MMTFLITKKYNANKKSLLFNSKQDEKKPMYENNEDGLSRSRNCEKVAEKYFKS